jgi:ureidoacrylate peracid hydrolase
MPLDTAYDTEYDVYTSINAQSFFRHKGRISPKIKHKQKKSSMNETTYEPNITGLLVVDPYNDFISDGGILWSRAKETAEGVKCVPHMLQALKAARAAGVRVFISPHHRWREGDYETWKYFAPTQLFARKSRVFAADTWGGEFHPDFRPQSGDIVAQEHWCSSGFANTDLDLQLKKHGVHKVIIIGLRANTCIDSTLRCAAELGYEVTLVKDAIAAFSWEEMKATIEVNAPSYATAILSTEELVARLHPMTRVAEAAKSEDRLSAV